MKRRLMCLLALLTVLIPAARAERLTIEECVGLARKNYPAVAQYGLIERTALFNLSNASKAYLPQGAVAGQLTWQNDVAAWPDRFAAMLAQQGIDFPGLDKTQYKVGVDLNQMIWDGGATSASRSAIKSAANVEQRALDVQFYDVEGRVEDVYFGILMLEGRIAGIDKSIALVDSTQAQLASMLRNGVAMQSDCDQMEAKLLALKQQRRQLEASAGTYKRVLELLIGEAIGGRELALPDENPVCDDRNPQLRLFDAQLRSIDSREAAVKASVMPGVGAFASGYYGYPGLNMFKNMQTHTPSFNFIVGVKVTWHFGALYSRGNSLGKLALQRQQIEADRRTYLLNRDMQQTEAESSISCLRDLMQSDRQIVELRQSVVSAAQSQLRHGVIDTTALLSKITEAELAENDLTLHRIELIKAIYNLNHIKNK